MVCQLEKESMFSHYKGMLSLFEKIELLFVYKNLINIFENIFLKAFKCIADFIKSINFSFCHS